MQPEFTAQGAAVHGPGFGSAWCHGGHSGQPARQHRVVDALSGQRVDERRGVTDEKNASSWLAGA